MACVAISFGGCATLPSSGPTASQIARDTGEGSGIELVELADFNAIPMPPSDGPEPLNEVLQAPTDVIGPGDILDINIYEIGISLFAGGRTAGMAGAAAVDPSTAAQLSTLPPIRVDDQGDIKLPYVGTLQVSGLTTFQLGEVIRGKLIGMSQSPQVLVTLREAISTSIIIGGEIGRPGRIVLVTNRETITDVIALAGGYRGDAKDLEVRVQRGDSQADFRLSALLSGEHRDFRIAPGDRISIVRAPRTFAVMGAPGRVEQIPFSGSETSLAEAIALAGGVNPSVGDPAAIFVFRFVQKGQKDVPTVYHLNMMKPGAYFISQKFAMRDNDVLYIGNARANQPSKLIQIISQLFAPIVTIRDVARSTGD